MAIELLTRVQQHRLRGPSTGARNRLRSTIVVMLLDDWMKVVSVGWIVISGCGGAGGGGESSFGTTSSTTSGSASSATDTSAEAGTASGTTGADDGPKFDLAGSDLPLPPDDGIPKTCAQAAAYPTTVGCRFYAVDLGHWGSEQPWAVGIANVQTDVAAEVVIETKQGGTWEPVVPAESVPPLDLSVTYMPQRDVTYTGVHAGASFRITSDVPIVVYQYNPVDGAASYTSDASLLYPSTSLDTLHHLLGWIKINMLNSAYGTVVATEDGTVVTFEPTATVEAGGAIPQVSTGMPFEVQLDEGDVLQFNTLLEDDGLSGTRIESNEGHPVAVFSGHLCATVPKESGACDHLEEQLAGLRLWGTKFVAARVPVRSTIEPIEPSLWQIYASEDDTMVTIVAEPEVTGLPVTPTVLQQGEMLEFYAAGPPDVPGDFWVEADKPIAVVDYMTGSSTVNLPDPEGIGDPAMAQLIPVEQFLERYVILVPTSWVEDVGVFTREAGSQVTIDGAPIPDTEFLPITAEYEVARVPLEDGVHVLEGEAPFSIMVVGMDDDDSYAYLGGGGTAVINPEPEG